jgi:hypothetical protein
MLKVHQKSWHQKVEMETNASSKGKKRSTLSVIEIYVNKRA